MRILSNQCVTSSWQSYFFSYGGHAHFFLSAEGNLLYCDSDLKLGDEVSDKSLPSLCVSSPALHHPQYGKSKESTPNPHSISTQLHPHIPVPSFHTKPNVVVWRQAAKLDKQGCGAAPLINKRCSAPWGWSLWGPGRVYPQTIEFACLQWTGNGENEPIMEI